jgi:hypothetical protein
MSSHFVYASSSFFWQHLDGQQEGQQQQQHKNGQVHKNITKGSRNTPIYIASLTTLFMAMSITPDS